MSDLAVVHYNIKTATTSTLHCALFSSLTQVHLSPSPEAGYFDNKLFNHVPRRSSSSSSVLNKAAKQGVIDSNQKKAEMDAKALHKPKLGLLLYDSLEEAKDSKDRWKSDEEEHAAKRRRWEEMNSKSQDVDKPDLPEDEAGKLEQERQRDAKDTNECAARLKAKDCDKTKKQVEDETTNLTPDQI
ncbi:hypothetical protein O181_100140 [Austropuccinia psidii MF-1]|uniref:Uncharacterized protein n=1 Tax=Austropuccinia psidii MF-1 TaxID=1389203 RepID=A0A9Q3JF03_9BASI|nr:hypothetical protein [Austropuccinia psidii MF-1]